MYDLTIHSNSGVIKFAVFSHFEKICFNSGVPKVLDAEGHFSDTVRACGPQGTMRAPKSQRLSCLAYKYTVKYIYFINNCLL